MTAAMCLRIAVLSVAAALCTAAPASEDHCARFTAGRGFSDAFLDGTIWTLTDSGLTTDSDRAAEDLFAGATYSWFYELTDKERLAYSVVMRQHFPDVDWSRVRYSWNFDNPLHGDRDSLRYLIEVGAGRDGDVRAVPVDVAAHQLVARPLRYRLRRLPDDALAIAYCAAPHVYELHAPSPRALSTT